ncbi:hypothetical protein [Candidatus Magnetaquicoccus inordinatus]|uniref:hypothetical protein n=1 Tax=Candidatus Magnetaquicoccus inordinatus TaxID=2496818 RepID=UPI00102CE892|nr:hypothetical protein [Candidatus Magnetaquicoccus inordinatus]
MKIHRQWVRSWNRPLISILGVVAGMAGHTVSAASMDAPSDKELSTMGQGFGKFVGSFMRQVQSDEEKKVLPGMTDERRQPERPSSRPAEWPAARDRDEEHTARNGAQNRTNNRNAPYPLYDPWGASWWSDPAFGFDPWGRSNSWVDNDWNARRWQYGWNYGGNMQPYQPYAFGPPYGGAPSPYNAGEGESSYPGGYEGERYPGYGYGANPYAAERWGTQPFVNERNAFNNEWLRQRDERHSPAAEETTPRYRNREGEGWSGSGRFRDDRWRRD